MQIILKIVVVVVASIFFTASPTPPFITFLISERFSDINWPFPISTGDERRVLGQSYINSK